MSSFDELEKEIERVKNNFYEESGGKKSIFKKQQKFDCARQVVNQIPIEVLLKNSCYIVNDTHFVHIDYPVLKSYMSPETFDIIAEYIFQTFREVIEKHNNLVTLLNLDGLTVSGAERYKGLPESFCKKCFDRNSAYSQVVSQFIVYNSPNIIESIRPIVYHLMEENVKSRLKIVLKKDSDEYNRVFHSKP